MRVISRALPQFVVAESAKLSVTPLQASVAVAVPVRFVVGDAGQSIVTSGGHVMTGGVASRTVIFCTQLDRLPQPSLAVHVRVMMRALPQSVVTESAKLTLAPPHVSVAVAVPVTFVVGEAGQSIVTSGGQLTVGGVESRTVMVCTALVEWPHKSVAVQVREITRALPQFVTVESAKLNANEPQASEATATPALFVDVLAGHSNVTSGGGTRLGAASRTVIVCTAFVVLPHKSVAVHVRQTVLPAPQLLLTTSL